MQTQTLDTHSAPAIARPPIVLSRTDHDALQLLVDSHVTAAAWPVLVEELDRARIVDSDALAPDVVTMGAAVEYRDEANGQARHVVLAFPGEQDIAAGRISILTPVGTALIGLSVGQTASWQTRSGEWKRLTILGVRQAPARQFNRGRAGRQAGLRSDRPRRPPRAAGPMRISGFADIGGLG